LSVSKIILPKNELEQQEHKSKQRIHSIVSKGGASNGHAKVLQRPVWIPPPTLTQDGNELQGEPQVVMFEFDQITDYHEREHMYGKHRSVN